DDDTIVEETLILNVGDSDSGYESEPQVVVKKDPKAYSSKRKRNDKEEEEEYEIYEKKIRRGRRFGHTMIRLG
nr:zinc finger BED domain-containing protein RICESLEEPER 2 [Tanacetum cinerariifolium]